MKNIKQNRKKEYLQLVKFPVSLTIASASLAGYLVQNPRVDTVSIFLFLSILLLACGCSCLNNYQDRFLDGRFSRTKDRPIPTNRVAPQHALVLSTVLILAGLYGLSLQSFSLFILGILAIGCYNFLYTPLKQRTPWAMLPGVVCGMLPPWIGWLAAGGETFSLKIWIIMMIFGVWQMPHFWLLLLDNEADYVKVGVPTLLTRLVKAQLERILLVWVVSLATLTLCLPLAHLIQTDGAFIALAVNAAGLSFVFCKTQICI